MIDIYRYCGMGVAEIMFSGKNFSDGITGFGIIAEAAGKFSRKFGKNFV